MLATGDRASCSFTHAWCWWKAHSRFWKFATCRFVCRGLTVSSLPTLKLTFSVTLPHFCDSSLSKMPKYHQGLFRITSISDWCRMPLIILHSLFVLTFWPLSSSHPTFLAFKLSVFSRRTLLCLQVLDVFPYFLERVTQYGSWTLQGLTEILPSLQNPFWLPGKTRVFLWAGFLVVAHLCCSPDDSILNSSSACFPLSSLWARRTASLTVDLCIPSAWLSVVNVYAAVLKVWSLDQQHQQHWELVRNADVWAPPQAYWTRKPGGEAQQCVLTGPPGESDAFLRIINPVKWMMVNKLRSHKSEGEPFHLSTDLRKRKQPRYSDGCKNLES